MEKSVHFSRNTVDRDAMARDIHAVVDAENLPDNNPGRCRKSGKNSGIVFRWLGFHRFLAREKIGRSLNRVQDYFGAAPSVTEGAVSRAHPRHCSKQLGA